MGDNYYDKRWQENLLKNRIYGDGFYHLNDIDHFWSLLYHGIIQKPSLTDDYIEDLDSIGQRHIKKYKSKILYKKRRALRFLKKYLKDQDYRVTRPIDKSVYYRYSLRAFYNKLIRPIIVLKEKMGIKRSLHFEKGANNLYMFVVKSPKKFRNVFIKIKYRIGLS